MYMLYTHTASCSLCIVHVHTYIHISIYLSIYLSLYAYIYIYIYNGGASQRSTQRHSEECAKKAVQTHSKVLRYPIFAKHILCSFPQAPRMSAAVRLGRAMGRAMGWSMGIAMGWSTNRLPRAAWWSWSNRSRRSTATCGSGRWGPDSPSSPRRSPRSCSQ